MLIVAQPFANRHVVVVVVRPFGLGCSLTTTAAAAVARVVWFVPRRLGTASTTTTTTTLPVLSLPFDPLLPGAVAY